MTDASSLKNRQGNNSGQSLDLWALLNKYSSITASLCSSINAILIEFYVGIVITGSV